MSYVFYAGLDLGQMQDYTALCVVEEPVWTPATGWASWPTLPREQRELYNAGLGPRWARQAPSLPPLYLRSLTRYPLRTPYPAIVADVRRRLNAATVLILDGTGVGVAITDMFRFADPPLSCDLASITITGGNEPQGHSVPKKDLIASVQVMLQSDRLQVAQETAEIKTWMSEMQRYRYKITEAKNLTFDARGDSEHDDLVLAAALAVYYRGRLNRGE